MRCLATAALLVAGLALSLGTSSAQAFGLQGLDVTFMDEVGSPDLQAGSHPFAMTTSLSVGTGLNGEGFEVPEGALKDLFIDQVPGLAGNPTATPRCSAADFNERVEGRASCADSTAVGIVGVKAEFEPIFKPGDEVFVHDPVYNLVPPPGVAARIGFVVLNVPITVDLTVSGSPPYEIEASLPDAPQALILYGSQLTLWGNPESSAHDSLRGQCVGKITVSTAAPVSLGTCPVNVPEKPFVTLPRACRGPLATTFSADSWGDPGNIFKAAVLTHDDAEPPNPAGLNGCTKLGFNPTIGASPTAKSANSPSGLDFSLNVKDEGLANPSSEAIANSDIERAVVTLPEGFTVNPSIAEGLGVCTEADLARETASSEPGSGCPEASKLGTVEVETPLLEGTLLRGSLYQAAPYENPFGSLIALYVVIQNPELGISIAQPLRVETDPQTGRITTTAEEMPQLPFSHFRLHFREGASSPLATPPSCGSHTVRAQLYPYDGADPVESVSTFELISGPDGAPCPTGGLPPFHPELLAGTVNNAAGSFSPFNVKITRNDSEQEITHFSIKLPPGVAGKLTGIPFCTDAQIAQAVSRTGPHGGAEELADPSCPAASQVGRTLAGAGVGPSLAYAPGKIYLAGPYHGAPLSLVSITSGVVGPFDIGTVVVRLAVKVNPETGEVFLDSTGSDPIPHIIKGIPVHLRDIRAYTDRPEFTFNPTSCEPTSTSSTVLGAGLDFASEADDNPFVSTSRFQAADCAALPFKPKLTLTLKGSTKRGKDPALHAHLAMKGFGEAGLAYARVALPKTEFLDNDHVGNICTRVEFREGAVEGERCPANSVIGHARAVTPILEAPLEGPIYLRANPERNLPDIAAALRGQEISVVAVGHTDSAPGGGLRNTFEVIPDAPISSVDIDLFGGSKGLLKNAPAGLANSICKAKSYATVRFTGHNGKRRDSRQALKVPGCGKKAKHPRRDRP